jgi:hypothetical protein
MENYSKFYYFAEIWLQKSQIIMYLKVEFEKLNGKITNVVESFPKKLATNDVDVLSSLTYYYYY